MSAFTTQKLPATPRTNRLSLAKRIIQSEAFSVALMAVLFVAAVQGHVFYQVYLVRLGHWPG